MIPLKDDYAWTFDEAVVDDQETAAQEEETPKEMDTIEVLYAGIAAHSFTDDMNVMTADQERLKKSVKRKSAYIVEWAVNKIYDNIFKQKETRVETQV